MSKFGLVAILLIVFLSLATQARAATVPNGFSVTNLTTSLNEPVAFAFAADGRIFITEKGGAVRVFKNNTLLTTPFVSVTTDSTGERGLLGIVLDPNFVVNNYVYVYYTVVATPRYNRLSRFTANGDVAAVGSEVVLMNFDNLSGATNHNGGALHFGPDGKLYVAVGDNATGSNAQSMTTRHGKILRLNSDGSIPTNNPFYATNTGLNRAIYAYGFRNPFSFSVDSVSGNIYINDVGQNTWEEFSKLQAGGNYGWPTCEGFYLTGSTVNTCNLAGDVVPLHSYGRAVGSSIAGSTFYRSGQFPASYFGDYFFADYVAGWIKVYDPVSTAVTDFASDADAPVDLHVGTDGSLYYLSIYPGKLVKITYGDGGPGCDPNCGGENSQPPLVTINTPIAGTTYNAGQTINYSGSAFDAEDGAMTNADYAWYIILHHDTHTHPYLGPINGVNSGSFVIPKLGETSANTWYEVKLQATDSSDTTGSGSVYIYPNKANIEIDSNVPGLTLNIDGIPQSAPISFTGVVGFTRNLEAPTTASMNGRTLTYSSWSDGGARNHDVDTPGVATRYTANYRTSEGGYPIYRFWSNQKQGHFFTIDYSEYKDVKANYNSDVWNYERVGYFAYPASSCAGKLPVYRFWSDQKQGHFYTIYEDEKQNVIDAYEDFVWKYEGVAYCVDTGSTGSNKAVYRFWSDRLQHHFYTIDAAERDDVINNLSSTWKYEGVAFYALSW